MRLVFSWILMVATSLGCAEEEERPDLVSVCSDDCKPGVAQSGGSGPSTPSVTSGTSTSGGGDVIELEGNLALFADDRFQLEHVLPFSESAMVFSEDADSRVLNAPYDGQSFTITGVQSGEATGVLVVPDDPNSIGWPSLLRVDTRESQAVTLPLVNSEVLSEIFASIRSQAVVEPDRGQLVLRFSDADEDPIRGVRVDVPQASFVAYAEGAAWSEDATETDASGLVVAGNILASDFPGSTLNVTASGAAVGSWVVTVIAGAASYDSLLAL